MPLIRRSNVVSKARFRPTKVVSSPVRHQPRAVRRSFGNATPRRRTPGHPSATSSTPGPGPGPGCAASHVKVAVRVRPRNAVENGADIVKPFAQHVLFDPDEDGDGNTFFYAGKRQLLPSAARKKHQNITYTFDHVFDESSCNAQVFAETMQRDVLGAVMSGFNASVFAYGATGAGKTHTMVGNASDPGITYRTVEELFRRARDSGPATTVEFQVSFLEVYNENVYDLLASVRESLPLLDDGKSVTVKNLTWHVPNSPGQLLHLLAEGNKRRAQSETLANKDSSRSHAVFTIQVAQRVLRTDGELPEKKLSKLMLVDLAGSERASATGHAAARFKEGTNINRSLLALGKCINDLVEGKSHINYRGSKLTRILKDCLGGNCRTVMLAAVSPTIAQFSDTKNTLEYATRARKISVNLKQNVRRMANSTADCLRLVGELQAQLATAQKEKAELEKRALLAEEQLRQQRPATQAVFRVPAAPLSLRVVDLEYEEEDDARGDNPNGNGNHTDILGQLRAVTEQQRELDAELRQVMDEKAKDHFRLERAKYMQDDVECLRSLNADGHDMKPDLSRVHAQVKSHHARMTEQEARLKAVMDENAAKIEKLLSRAREAGCESRTAFAADAMRAKLEAASCRATMGHLKNLLVEAEREICHQRRVVRVSLPLVKRSCLLLQRNGRDQHIESTIKVLQGIVARRDGVRFNEETENEEKEEEEGEQNGRGFLFLPPVVACPAVRQQCEKRVEGEEDNVEFGGRGRGHLERNKGVVKPKEKWVKVDVKEEEDEDEDDTEEHEWVKQEQQYATGPVAEVVGQQEGPTTPVRNFRNVLCSTPYSTHRFPTTPGGTSIVDYALSDEDDQEDKEVDKTWVREDVENRNPFAGFKGAGVGAATSKPHPLRNARPGLQQPFRPRSVATVASSGHHGSRPYASAGVPLQHPAASTRMVQPRFPPPVFRRN